jgi:hypothetical protein
MAASKHRHVRDLARQQILAKPSSNDHRGNPPFRNRYWVLEATALGVVQKPKQQDHSARHVLIAPYPTSQSLQPSPIPWQSHVGHNTRGGMHLQRTLTGEDVVGQSRFRHPTSTAHLAIPITRNWPIQGTHIAGQWLTPWPTIHVPPHWWSSRSSSQATGRLGGNRHGRPPSDARCVPIDRRGITANRSSFPQRYRVEGP